MKLRRTKKLCHFWGYAVHYLMKLEMLIVHVLLLEILQETVYKTHITDLELQRHH